MVEYENEDYLDGEERKPRLIKVLLFIFLIFILLLIIISCSIRKKDSNNFLKNISIDGGELTPTFNKTINNYNIVTDKDSVRLKCSAVSKKATTYGCNKRIYSNSKRYSVKVKAQNGDVRVYYFTINGTTSDISELNKTDIKVSIESKKEDNSILLKTVVEPSGSLVDYKWYKDNTEIKDENLSSIKVSENGVYTVKVVDRNTNKEYISDYKVDSFKKEEPKNNTSSKVNTTKTKSSYVLEITSITGNSSKWTSSVTLTVNVKSSLKLASNAYSFDGGKTYQQSNKKTFTSNGNVDVVVKNINGSTVKKTITISKIDNTIPSISITASNKTNTSVTLTAYTSPSNTSSGYRYEWYKNNKLISGANSKTYKVTSTGDYYVRVITGTANITVSKVYSFKVIKVTCPTLSATLENGKNVNPKTWVKSPIYLSIKPSSETVSYDIYTNKSNIFDYTSKEFKYYNTLKGNNKLRLVNSGKRVVKFVVRDKYGNSNTCYSKIYYIQ